MLKVNRELANRVVDDIKKDAFLRPYDICVLLVIGFLYADAVALVNNIDQSVAPYNN